MDRAELEDAQIESLCEIAEAVANTASRGIDGTDLPDAELAAFRVGFRMGARTIWEGFRSAREGDS